jgi:mannose-6-phosphate isomerase-like protein (cupin superfamily)
MESRAERFDLVGFCVRLLEGHHHDPFSVQEWRAPPGVAGIPMHVHHRTTEAFYVVEGEIALWLDDRRLVYGPGSYVVVRPGQRHTFGNPSGEPAIYLTVISPAGFEQYLKELARGLSAAQTDDEASALRERLSEAYDIKIVGPPPPR